MKAKQIVLNILGGVVTAIFLMLLIFTITLVSFNLVYFSTPVQGYSMYPTLNSTVERDDIDGDTAFVNRFKSYANNDIVVARVSWFSKGPIIKRVIAVSGQTVEVKLEDDVYKLFVNEKCVSVKEKNDYTEIFYKNYLKFISNNLDIDTSKNVKDNKIIINKNEVFLLGDNWGVSEDCMKNGVVKTECITGKVDFVVPYKHNKYDYILKKMGQALFYKNK